ncbi:Fanconi anemia core complex-associated protein 20 isoform 7 [Homo sapiens]|uniref:Uncharacterized protein n=1 Tax=Homo sapiens TaxID=9606 RepID=Q7Z4P6_HUMAN|nr:Fanconi anemia core complex-associated protein 20 isoform 7 [Homo sapiens]NP_001269601.1 Fanconi anemia core complex-associated protein 20 isoform 7 [Homo sapiens]AAP97719.1 hypothetical protein [Homo sapiens]|eukprot:NP_001269600.1 Fanconi anemia core complex-associated protein 20 isoform 7 [Homo sapiens]
MEAWGLCAWPRGLRGNFHTCAPGLTQRHEVARPPLPGSSEDGSATPDTWQLAALPLGSLSSGQLCLHLRGTSTPAPTCVPLAPKLPPYVWVASEMWGRRHSRKKGIRGASTSSEHFIPQDATRSLSWRSRSVHRVLFPWKMCTLETA